MGRLVSEPDPQKVVTRCRPRITQHARFKYFPKIEFPRALQWQCYHCWATASAALAIVAETAQV